MFSPKFQTQILLYLSYALIYLLADSNIALIKILARALSVFVCVENSLIDRILSCKL